MKEYDKEYLNDVFEEIGSWPQEKIKTTYLVNGKEIELSDDEDDIPEIDGDDIVVETDFFDKNNSVFYKIRANKKEATFIEYSNGNIEIEISLNEDDLIKLLHLDDEDY